MKFTTKHDIETPADYAFAALTDFEAWERTAMRRGAEIARTDKLAQPAEGMSWRAKFTFRGRARTVDMRLLKMTASSKIELVAQSPALEAKLIIDIVAMSAKRARLHVVSDVTPRTLTAKLFIQSLRLGRARADRKYAFRVAQIAQDIEERYRSEQKMT